MNVVLLAEVTIEQVIGGAERVLRQQALGLAKLGHDVRVIARAPFESAEADLSIGSRDRTAVFRQANQRAGLCLVFSAKLSSGI